MLSGPFGGRPYFPSVLAPRAEADAAEVDAAEVDAGEVEEVAVEVEVAEVELYDVEPEEVEPEEVEPEVAPEDVEIEELVSGGHGAAPPDEERPDEERPDRSPAADEPVEEEPAAREPAAQEPAEEEPAEEEPVGEDEGATEDQSDEAPAAEPIADGDTAEDAQDDGEQTGAWAWDRDDDWPSGERSRGSESIGGDDAELYDLEPEATAALPRFAPSEPSPPPALDRSEAAEADATEGEASRRPRSAGSPPLQPPRQTRSPRPPSKVPRAVVLKQRARRRRALIGFTFFTAACVFLTGTSYLYLQHKLGQIQRVTLSNLSEDTPGEVMNVLLVGSDSRDRLQGADALQAGKGKEAGLGQRSDTIMVLHIDPRQEQAAILSIPRDVVVPIAGTDLVDRVNTAFSLGGAEGLITTVQQSLGITVNHYVEVDFVGFKDIVDAVGGVEIYLPRWARDFTSGLDLPKIGCFSVNGTQGLAFVRSRQYEELIDGKWVTDPTGDFGRIARQQDFIRRMLKKALSTGITNPIQLNRLIGIGINDVKIDQTLSTKDIALLARRFSNLDPDNVLQYTLPAEPAFIDGKSAMRLQEAEAEPFIEFMNGNVSAVQPVVTAPPGEAPAATVAPGDIEVRILNGIGTAGAAGRASTALEDAGYEVSGTGDSPVVARTTIRHPAGALDKAQALQAALTAGAELSVDEAVTGGDVVLVLGSDFDGLKPRPRGTPSTLAGEEGSPTTTVAGQPQTPADVDIRVLNGIGTAGAAGKASTALKAAGHTVSGTGDSSRVGRTTIRHRVGTLAQAKALQESLQSGAELAVDTDLAENALVLVLGADYAGLKADAAAGGEPVATTTTSIAPPTTVARDHATDC